MIKKVKIYNSYYIFVACFYVKTTKYELDEYENKILMVFLLQIA